jgi:AcrR family transcriptional regulator
MEPRPQLRRQSLKIDVERVLDQAEVPEAARRERESTPAPSARSEQIALHAIEYFNEFGASRVSINQLAASLNMSPGNLHYHFRTNSDLYRRLFDILNRDIREILVRPRMPMTLDKIVQHHIDIQACLWRHRYFFRDLDYLVHADEAIFVDFLHLQNWAVGQLVNLQEFYRANFNMQPIEAPNSGVEVAQNCWMMWISWIRWEAIANGRQVLTQAQVNEIFHRLVWHHFSMHGPYMTPKTASTIAHRLKQKLLKNK